MTVIFIVVVLHVDMMIGESDKQSNVFVVCLCVL